MRVKRERRSLRARLTAMTILLTVVVLGCAATIATWQIRHVTDRALGDAMGTRLATARDEVTASGRLKSSAAATGQATFVQVLDAGGNVVSSSPALTGLPPLMTLTDARRGLGTPRQVGLAAPDIDLAIVGSAFRVQGRPGALIVGLESQGFLDARHELSVVLLVGLPLAVVLSGALAWALTGRTLRSVRRLAEEADAISLGEPGRSLVVDTRDTEVARLVAALNRMLTRLDSRYAVNLAAAAATTHRLRTPLATLRLDAELGLAEDDPEATRETLKRVIADVDRLGSLVDLLLANADLRTEHRVLLTDAVAELGEEWQRQARTRRRDLLIEVSGQGSLDVNILRAAADPLVENAIEYSAGDEPIVARLTVRAVEGHDAELTLEIENTGLGVPPDVTGRLFEPWTGTRNSGLGLWLAREAARAGGGEISCVEPGPPRTVFRLVLPVAGPIPA